MKTRQDEASAAKSKQKPLGPVRLSPRAHLPSHPLVLASTLVVLRFLLHKFEFTAVAWLTRSLIHHVFDDALSAQLAQVRIDHPC